MTRARRWVASGAAPVAVGLALAVAARGGDHPARVLPANAVQPPGASFEQDATRRQKAMLVRESLGATVAGFVARPLRATALASARVAERLGVRVAGTVPGLPLAPSDPSPEAGGPCTPARLTPLYDSGPAYQALLDLIAGARCRVDLMIFGWDDDTAGRRVADALIARAREGLPIRLLVDRGGFLLGTGNARAGRGLPTFLDALKAEPNIRVIEAPGPFFRYDHRKVAVVDDRIVWTGGMILTRSSLERWHNFAFLAEGAIVPQYAALFAGRWAELGGCPAPACAAATDIPAAAPNAAVRMVRTDLDERSLRDAVYGAVDSAKHHITLENPYFGDQILVKKLVAAAGRGVDVRAILTMRGDVASFNRIVNFQANALLRGGVRVFLYPAMTHVKAMSVDGDLAYLGTGNFDELSLRNNREVALMVRGPALIREIDEHLFGRDLAASEELRALLPAPRGQLALRALLLWY